MSALAGRTWRDVILAAFAVQWTGTGLWAVLAPRSFYDTFPGGGRQWIAVDGPFNEHLLRDVGGLFCALGVLAAFALWQRSPAVVRAAGLAITVFSVPHVLYHLANTDVLSTGDVVASVGSLAIGLTLAVALVISPAPAGGRTTSPG
ncbi:hypothetical protein BH20ACT2_BH20ACT2_17390 [soil metagenome]